MNIMKKTFYTFLPLLAVMILSSCNLANYVEGRASNINHYEKAALHLAKDNRHLENKIGQLRFEIQQLKNQNDYLQIQLDEAKGKTKKRQMASTAHAHQANGEDAVQFDVYQWTPAQVLAMAESEFEKKNFEKSAQFFEAFALKFPDHKKVDDHFYFFAGMAAYESGTHHDWTLKNFGKLVEKYPASPFYRRAKLWTALTQLQMGNQKQFFSTVEEFRKKYRNTSEWEVLSQHYEKIVQKYKN
jgi:TolA-binding protein